MISGEEVLEALGREHGVDFVGELHPYDRKQIEDALDYEIEMGSSVSEDIDAALEELAEDLEARVTAALSRACDEGLVSEERFAAVETALHSEIRDALREAKRRT